MERKMSVPIRILLIVTVLVFAGLSFYNVGESRTYQNQGYKLSKIGFTGVFQPEGSSLAYEWSGDKETSKKRYSFVTFAGRFDQDIPAHETMLFLLPNIGMELYVNGEQIGSLAKPGSFPDSSKSAGKGWFSFTSPGISREDQITIVLESRYQYNASSVYNTFASNMYVGDVKSLFTARLFSDGILLLIGGALGILGLFLMLLLVILNLSRTPVGRASTHLALFLLSGGIWLALYPGVLTLLIPAGIFFNLFYTAATGLTISLFVIYLMDFVKGRLRWCFLVISILCLCGSLAAMILQGLGIWDGSQVLSLVVFPGIAGLLIGTVAQIRQWKKRRTNSDRLLLVSLLLLVLLGGVDLINIFLPFVVHSYGLIIGFCLFAILQLMLIVGCIRKNIEEARTAKVSKSGSPMENGLHQSRIEIMLSQIRSGFLYDSLTFIRHLCMSDPRKTEFAIKEFAEYLKGNIGSLTNEKLIPFQMELEHVRHYLELEKMRYPDLLNVMFEIRTVDFELPPLTLQAVVENAVCHGVIGKTGGGTVIITSWEAGGEYQVSVTDDGVGFNPQECLDIPGHIGLANTKKRIAAMCRGTLQIDSEPGLGTTVTLIIPK